MIVIRPSMNGWVKWNSKSDCFNRFRHPHGLNCVNTRFSCTGCQIFRSAAGQGLKRQSLLVGGMRGGFGECFGGKFRRLARCAKRAAILVPERAGRVAEDGFLRPGRIWITAAIEPRGLFLRI